jgi:hypothetical protein
MPTIDQTEAAQWSALSSGCARPMIGSEELPFSERFFPFGFPADVRTNSQQVLEQYANLWGKFYQEQDTEPIRCDVQRVEGTATECPPAPTYRLMLPLMAAVADGDNYCIVDLDRALAKVSISTAVLKHPLYAQNFFFALPACCIATQYATPVHAACVALQGRGVLLCGDSGAGKSTLAYACARFGWTYVSDDGSYIVNGGKRRMVTGNCHQLRFRPSVASIFPELEGAGITPRAAGKPSIELSTAPMTNIRCSQTTQVDFVLFLNRRRDGRSPQLASFSRENARESMRQVLYGSEESLARQYDDIENLLTAEIFEFRYSCLDTAVDRLRRMVETGH